MSIENLLSDLMRGSTLVSLDQFLERSVVTKPLFDHGDGFSDPFPDLDRWDQRTYLLIQDVSLQHGEAYLSKGRPFLYLEDEQKCKGARMLLEYDAHRRIPAQTTTIMYQLEDFLMKNENASRINSLYEQSNLKNLVQNPKALKPNTSTHYSDDDLRPGSLSEKYLRFSTEIRDLFHSSYLIADLYYLFHVSQSIWDSQEGRSAIINANDVLLRRFIDNLGSFRPDVIRHTNIYLKFSNLRNKIFVSLAKARAMVPSGFFRGGVDKIGDYPVNGGGFADVWRGSMLRDCVALKILRRPAVSSGRADENGRQVRSLCREAVLWKMANHPNVHQFIGLSRLDDARGSVAFVSPWLRHGNLLQYVQQNRVVNRKTLLAQVGMGLLYLHSIDIIHGDLKCANILVNDLGAPQLSDFGLSTMEPMSMTVSGSLSSSGGNPRWLAPELMLPSLFDGSGRSTRESDVHAFGMTALELFTEKAPFCDVLCAALPLEVAVNGLEPSWPGSEATARGLTDEIWAMMQGYWKQDPSSRTKLHIGLFESSLIRITNYPVSSKDITLPNYNTPENTALVVSGPLKSKRSSVSSTRCSRASNRFSDALNKLRLSQSLERSPYSVPWNDNKIRAGHLEVSACTYERSDLNIGKHLRNLKKLQHKNIAELLGWCYLPMQITTAIIFDVDVSAEPILNYLRRGYPPCVSEADDVKVSEGVNVRLKFMSDIANGLAYLHGSNVMHGNLRSANIVVQDGVVLLVDYGISYYSRAALSSCIHKRFEAPERWRNKSKFGPESATESSDIYALAMTFYEVLTSRMPFEGYDIQSHDFDVCVGFGLRPSLPVFRTKLHGTLSWIWNLMCRCWSSKPRERPSAAGVRCCLNRLRFWPDVQGQDPDFLIPIYLSEERDEQRAVMQNLKRTYDDAEDMGSVLGGPLFISQSGIVDVPKIEKNNPRTKWRRVDGWLS